MLRSLAAAIWAASGTAVAGAIVAPIAQNAVARDAALFAHVSRPQAALGVAPAGIAFGCRRARRLFRLRRRRVRVVARLPLTYVV